MTTPFREFVDAVWASSTTWSTWEKVLESGFTLAALGTGFGAWAGAWAAQKIALKTKAIDDIRRELRDANAATGMAFAILNSALVMKKQHIKPMWDGFQAERQKCLNQIKRVEEGIPGAAVHASIEGVELQPQSWPVDELQRYCYEKLSLSGRALMLVFSIATSARERNQTIARRNELLSELHRYADVERAVRYFGITVGAEKGGTFTDARYALVMDGLYTQTDDVLMLCSLLIDDIKSHGRQLVDELKKLTAENIPKIDPGGAWNAETSPFRPDESNYSSWVNWPPASAQSGEK